MSVESRGRLNIATCFVVGSIDTTINVSVLYVPSFGRWSDPIRRMFSRSVPSQGGIDTSGRSEPCGGGAERVGSGESAGSSLEPGVAEPDGPGEPDAVSSQSAVPLGSFTTKMHGSWRTSFARRSYFAMTTWTPDITRMTARRPATDSGLNMRRGRPRRPPAFADRALRY